MFLTPSLRKKCLSMKKYNQLLDNSFSPKTTIYQSRVYLQQYDNIQPVIEDNFDDIIFIKKDSTEKSKVKEVSKITEKPSDESSDESTEKPSDESTEKPSDDETSDNIPVLPAAPSDNKKTIIISQKILDSANIKDNIFSDDEEEENNNDKELFGGKNNENSFF